jgi:hypothetical protein
MANQNQYLFTKVSQQFARAAVDDIGQTVRDQFEPHATRFPKGARIAIAVGSRGVANIATIARSVVECVKAAGCEPFVIPAMGSHGGATDEGQRDILATYGVTEEAMSCPVRSSMEVVELDNGGLELPLYMDRNAYESDGVILINRIKPHTNFRGQYESGLCKMSVIGLGKERLASAVHSYGIYGLKTLMPEAAKRILATGKILMGVGVVENAYDETAVIEALTPQGILEREPELLKIAKEMMPSLPLKEVDVLLVDQLGKNISGSGMDPNIIGRMDKGEEPEQGAPKVKVIVVTDITEASHGNACGVGLADVTTRRLANKVDWDATYMNAVTSGFYQHSSLPVVAATDAQALEWGIRASHEPNKPKKIVRITDTLHLSQMYLSDPALTEIKDRVETLSRPQDLFDEKGSLIAF